MKQPSTNARGNVERRKSLFALDGTANCSAIMEISVRNSQEAKINVPYDPAILLIGICPRDSTLCSTHICSAMCIVLLTIART